MDSLSREQLAVLELRLIRSRNELQEQLEISEQSTQIVNLDQTAVGRVSRIDAMQQQSMALSAKSKAKAKLKKVALALMAIKNSDYGRCQQCEDDIGFPRLNVQPEASLCLDCQSKVDRN